MASKMTGRWHWAFILRGAGLILLLSLLLGIDSGSPALRSANVALPIRSRPTTGVILPALASLAPNASLSAKDTEAPNDTRHTGLVRARNDKNLVHRTDWPGIGPFDSLYTQSPAECPEFVIVSCGDRELALRYGGMVDDRCAWTTYTGGSYERWYYSLKWCSSSGNCRGGSYNADKWNFAAVLITPGPGAAEYLGPSTAQPYGDYPLWWYTGDSPRCGDMVAVTRAVPGTLQFSTDTFRVGEVNGMAWITVTRTTESDDATVYGTAAVDYTTTDGTAMADVDYVSVSKTITFTGSLTETTFVIPILQDTIMEGDETVNLTLSNPTSGATLGSPSTATLIITGNPVNSTGDDGDADVGDGACDTRGTILRDGNPETECTLRAAIQEANATAGTDTITFDIPGGGVPRITPDDELPEITDPAVIDGTSQPGGGKVELDGTNAGSGASGLIISASDSTIRGLIVNRFPGAGLVLEGGGGNLIEDNFIGTDPAGSPDLGNGSNGILISNSSDNTITQNKIAHNGGNGVQIIGNGAVGNTISEDAIYDNGGLGVDLGEDSVTPNDPNDLDTGLNNLQNFAVIDFMGIAPPDHIVLYGYANTGSPGTRFRIDFFSNSVCDASGYGEGETYLTSVEGTAQGDPYSNPDFGILPFTVFVPEGSTNITTRVTNLTTGDTSEYSRCVSGADSLTIIPQRGLNLPETSHTVTVWATLQEQPPVANLMVDFEIVSGPNAGIELHQNTEAGRVDFTYQGSGEGVDQIQVKTVSSSGYSIEATAEKEWAELTLTLTPLQATNPVGTDHTVTARVVRTSTGQPVASLLVSFQVVSGPHTGKSGLAVTDASGQASFTYRGETSGIDTIEAAMTIGEVTLSALAQKIWSSSDIDGDGVESSIEDGAPHNGDGNNDGTPDSQQANVASLPNAVDGQYVTLASPAGTSLAEVQALADPAPGTPPPTPNGLGDFPLGFFSFKVQGLDPGGATEVTLFLPPGTTATSYWKYGPTPDNPTPHWYEFLFDGTTGAEILPDRVVLHFVDGQRGDSDLSANGEIVDPGAPALSCSSATLTIAFVTAEPANLRQGEGGTRRQGDKETFGMTEGLQAAGLPLSLSPHPLVLTARVSNTAGAQIAAGLPVAFYANGTLLGTAATTQALDVGASEVVTVTWTSETPGDHTIIIVANDDGTGTGPATLCSPPAPVQQLVSILDVPLAEGWNLMSAYVNPFNTACDVVQRPITGTYVVIQGFDGGAQSYYPDLPPAVNTLTDIDAKHGYWVKVKATGELGRTGGNWGELGGTQGNLVLEQSEGSRELRGTEGEQAVTTQAAATWRFVGAKWAEDHTLNLNAGWNLASYLPRQPLPLADALQSIAGQYFAVLGFDQGALSYYPDLDPSFNTLTTMEPLHGYWIKMNQAGTLRYPATGDRPNELGTGLEIRDQRLETGQTSLARDSRSPIPNLQSPISNLSPTHTWVNFYGTAHWPDGTSLPAGATVQALDPDGVVCGAAVITTEGRYGLLACYGDDPTTPEDEGAQPGDTVRLEVAGQELGAAAWTEHGARQWVPLGPATVWKVWLPLVLGVEIGQTSLARD